MDETVIIGGEDFSATDREARQIIDYLADGGLRESRLPSLRELVNMVLKAQKALRQANR